jgi:hypothetical protein
MNDNGYENAPATKMLATQCAICGRPLCDAISVQLGTGPECRKEYDGGISEEIRVKANELVFKAAIAAQNGEITAVQKIAEEIRELGLGKLANRVGRRFRNAARYTEIVLSVEGGDYRVETPFRRGAKKEFIDAWRKIPGRRFRNNANYVPLVQKQALWKLLKRFFGGKFAKGPKGLFRIPEPEFEPEQGELPLQKVG